MEDFSDVDHVLHDFCLTDISRNAVKHKSIDIGFEFVSLDRSVDGLFPKLDRDLVRHELTFAGVFEKCLTDQKLLDDISAVRARAADTFGVNSTPTFFINGKKMSGGPTLDEFDKAFGSLLKS